MQQLTGAIGALLINLGATVADPAAWRALLVAILVGALVLVVGRVIAIRTGILAPDAPEGEALGIGLSTGLIVAAAVWAAAASGGRSSFTVIAVAFVGAIALTFRRRRADPGSDPAAIGTVRPRRAPFGYTTILGSIAFVVIVGLLFGATMAPSPRDGVQPVEFMDEAFYSILGRDIVATGTEAFYSPSGFGAPPGLPEQNWYHWGELWLAGAVGRLGVEATFARHLAVLPLLLLAIAAVIGSIARRAIGSTSRSVFVFGAIAGLLLAPLPVPIPGNYFSTWASGLLFSITMYGLAALLVSLLMLLVLRRRDIPAERPATVLVLGSLVATLLPAHIGMAIIAFAGIGVALAVLAVQLRLETGRIPRPPRASMRVAASAIGMLVLTFAWGTVTGHRVIGSGSSPLITPFNHVWAGAMLATLLGALTLLAIPVAWLLVRRRRHDLATMLLTAMAIVGGGAVAWGLRLAEFTMFHVFFGGIVIFATPMAVAAVLVVWQHLRQLGRGMVALALVAVAVLQVEMGVYSSGVRLAQFSPRDYPPVPLKVLATIRTLEPGAKIGYACHQQEEIAYWDARLLSIDMHTGRRVVPLCYEADFLAPFIGADGITDTVSPMFPVAPQYALFPTPETRPTPEEVVAFMEQAGIGYLYVDAAHPNTLVPDAVPVIIRGDTQLLRLP